MATITVQNESGQVASFYVDGDNDPRALILEQRIKRGELTKTSKKSSAPVRRGRQAVVDSDTGLKDEKGDWLKSVHGGGVDPDAEGDALGQPSGSKKVEGAVEYGGVSDAAVAQAEAQPASAAAKKAAAKRADSQG